MTTNDPMQDLSDAWRKTFERMKTIIARPPRQSDYVLFPDPLPEFTEGGPAEGGPWNIDLPIPPTPFSRGLDYSTLIDNLSEGHYYDEDQT